MGWTFLQGANSTSGLTTYTFSSQNLGAADAARQIRVDIFARALSGNTTIDAVTVGGISATAVVQQFNASSASNVVGQFIVNVPTGTTGDVVVTFSGAQLRAAIALSSSTDLNPTPTATYQSTDDPPTASVNVVAGGDCAGCAVTGAGATWSWTGITEVYDQQIGATACTPTSAHSTFGTTQTGLTVTASPTASTARVGVFSAWQLAAAPPATNAEFGIRAAHTPNKRVGPQALRQGMQQPQIVDNTVAPVTDTNFGIRTILPNPHVGPMVMRQGWRQPPYSNPVFAPITNTNFGVRTILPNNRVGPPALRRMWRGNRPFDLTVSGVGVFRPAWAARRSHVLGGGTR